MKDYIVSFIKYINYSVTAESEEEAIDAAEMLFYQQNNNADYDEVDVWED